MKLLKIVFFLLIIITLAELGYLFYLKRTPKPFTQQAPTAFPVTPAGGSGIIPQETYSYLTDELIPYLKELKSVNSKRFFVQEEDQGFVKDIRFDENEKKLYLSMVDEKNNTLFNFNIKESVLPLKKFSWVVNGVKQQISYKDIKLGDKITFVTFRDLINKDIYYNEYIIEE